MYFLYFTAPQWQRRTTGSYFTLGSKVHLMNMWKDNGSQGGVGLLPNFWEEEKWRWRPPAGEYFISELLLLLLTLKSSNGGVPCEDRARARVAFCFCWTFTRIYLYSKRKNRRRYMWRISLRNRKEKWFVRILNAKIYLVWVSAFLKPLLNSLWAEKL